MKTRTGSLLSNQGTELIHNKYYQTPSHILYCKFREDPGTTEGDLQLIRFMIGIYVIKEIFLPVTCKFQKKVGTRFVTIFHNQGGLTLRQTVKFG